MKIIGFLEIHNPEVKCSKNIEDLSIACDVNYSNLESNYLVESYLALGIPIIKMISPVYDIENNLIGSYTINTDGVWIWPSYYSYYLKKYPNIKVPNDFINHIKLNNAKLIEVSPLELKYVGFVVSKLLGIKTSINKEAMLDINALVLERGEEIECYP